MVASSNNDFNAKSPMPTSVMSRFANASKPRLVIPHVTEYAGYFTLAVPLGIQIAIERLANHTPHLSKFELQVDLYESNCNDKKMIDQSMALFEYKINKAILPIHTAGGCPPIGQLIVGEVARYYNFISLAVVDIEPQAYHESARYPNFFTMGESIAEIYQTLATFMQQQGWKRIAVVGEDHIFFNKVSRTI